MTDVDPDRDSDRASEPTSIAEAVAAARGELAAAVQVLAGADARQETLADYVPSRRVLLIQRGATMLRLGSVWRLGVLLLAADGRLDATGAPALHATGAITRATDPRHPNHQSLSAEARREFRAAAVRAGFATGETVNFDAAPIVLGVGTGPVLARDGQLVVQWNPVRDPGAVTPFAAYLHERVDLLEHPPQGA